MLHSLEGRNRKKTEDGSEESHLVWGESNEGSLYPELLHGSHNVFQQIYGEQMELLHFQACLHWNILIPVQGKSGYFKAGGSSKPTFKRQGKNLTMRLIRRKEEIHGRGTKVHT